MAMVEPELAFLEVKIEGLPVDAAKLRKSNLRESPEVLDPVDVGVPSGELVLSMVHPVVLAVPQVDQAVVPTPPIRMDRAPRTYFHLDNTGQYRTGDIGDDLRVHLSPALQDPEDDRLSPGPTPAFATNSPWAEVRFIDLDRSPKRGGSLTGIGDLFADEASEPIDRIAIESGRFCDLHRREIEREQLQELTKFRVRNL